jgi:hypothetical protein
LQKEILSSVERVTFSEQLWFEAFRPDEYRAMIEMFRKCAIFNTKCPLLLSDFEQIASCRLILLKLKNMKFDKNSCSVYRLAKSF